MTIVAAIITVLAWICLAAPVWYLPVRRVFEHFGRPRTISGRVKRAALIDWLYATGHGLFLGAFLLPLSQVLWTHLR